MLYRNTRRGARLRPQRRDPPPRPLRVGHFRRGSKRPAVRSQARRLTYCRWRKRPRPHRRRTSRVYQVLPSTLISCGTIVLSSVLAVIVTLCAGMLRVLAGMTRCTCTGRCIWRLTSRCSAAGTSSGTDLFLTLRRELNECVACSVLREAIQPKSSSSGELQALVSLVEWMDAHTFPSSPSESGSCTSDTTSTVIVSSDADE